MDLDKIYSIPFYGKGSSKLITEDKSNKYPQGYFKDKKCRLCSSVFKPYAPSHHYCSLKCLELAKADSYYRRNYKISIFQYYDIYIKNNGKCYICNSEGFKISWNNPSTDLALDHNHKTGKVRGLLCHNCNRALGLLKDDISLIEKAKNYLLSDLVLKDYDINNPLFRDRISKSANTISKETLYKIFDLYYNQRVIPSKIAEQLNITANTVRNICKATSKYKRKEREEWFNLNDKSVTTIS